jgi:hypothetical protein
MRYFWPFCAGLAFAEILMFGLWEAWHDGYRHGSNEAWDLVQRVITHTAH